MAPRGERTLPAEAGELFFFKLKPNRHVVCPARKKASTKLKSRDVFLAVLTRINFLKVIQRGCRTRISIIRTSTTTTNTNTGECWGVIAKHVTGIHCQQSHVHLDVCYLTVVINLQLGFGDLIDLNVKTFFFVSHRHVQLPKDLAKLVPKSHLMTEAEWRGLGVQQSQGWIHYMIHQPGNI